MLASAPTLKAATGMSSSSTRAWSTTQSASISCMSSTRAVSAISSAVMTDRPWQPSAAKHGQVGLDAGGADRIGHAEA